MSGYMIVTLVLVLVWLSIGVVLSIVMARRGHLGVGWGALGAMLGPLAVVAAMGTARHEKEEQPAVVVPTLALGGPVDVVVGIDGSPECRMAVQRVVSLFGRRLGRLCLATVVPYEDVPAHTDSALAELHRRGRLSGVIGTGEELLHGPPAQALAEFAQSGGYHILAVGSRGKGLSKSIVGSTATALAANSPVPVLIVGPQPAVVSAAA